MATTKTIGPALLLLLTSLFLFLLRNLCLAKPNPSRNNIPAGPTLMDATLLLISWNKPAAFFRWILNMMEEMDASAWAALCHPRHVPQDSLRVLEEAGRHVHNQASRNGT
ncbi:hypothetical protein ACLOJK_012201 [Asimina triloba]